MTDFDPQVTQATAPGLESAASELISAGGRAIGAGDDLATSITNGAVNFSDAIAPSVEGRGADTAAAASTVYENYVLASGVTTNFASDVRTYNDFIADLWAEWNEFKASLADLPALDQDNVEIMSRLSAKAADLNKQADSAYEDLESAAKDRGDDLGRIETDRHGLARDLSDGGHLGFAGWNLWGESVVGVPDVVAERYAREVKALTVNNRDMSQEDLERLNEILAQFGEHANFATYLMNEIGPEGVLETSGMIGTGDFSSEMTARAFELLGVTLATATDPNKAGDQWVGEEWIQDLMNAGTTALTSSDGTTFYGPGYAALAPLLLQSEVPFAPEFLVPIAEHMSRLDADGAWQEWSRTWHLGEGNPYDVDGRIGDGFYNAALVALNNNPESSTIFLSENGAYDELTESYVFAHGDRALAPHDDNLVYLLSGESPLIDVDLAGNAIEAGATGLPAGSEVHPDNPVHSKDMTEIMRRTMEYAVENMGASAGNDDGYENAERAEQMFGNFANMTLHYLPDFLRAEAEPRDVEWLPSIHGAPLFSVSASDGGHDSLSTRWMELLGHHEEAGTTVVAATQTAVSNAMINAMASDQQMFDAQSVGNIGAQIAAAIANGASDASDAGALMEAQDQNQLTDSIIKGANAGAAVGTGYLTSNPWLGAAVGVGIGEGLNFGAEKIGLKLSDEEIAEMREEARDKAQVRYDNVVDNFDVNQRVGDALREASEAAGNTLSDRDIEDLIDAFWDSYSNSLDDSSFETENSNPTSDGPPNT